MSNERDISTAEGWFQLVKERTQNRMFAAAGVLSVLVLFSEWGNWYAIKVMLAWFAFSIPANIVWDHTLGKRLGLRGEMIRTVFNNLCMIPVFGHIDWPLPAWFWLAYMALTYDTMRFRTGIFTMLFVVACQTLSAYVHDVPLTMPLYFGVFAMIVYFMVQARTEVLREVAVQAQKQRDELARAHDELKFEIAARERAEVELRQAQKLEAIGRLAAGVAHEINTPMQFLSDSLEFVSDGTKDLLALASDCASPDAAERADLPYLSSEMPTSLAQAQAGVRRVAAIIRSMKELAHPGDDELAPVDINHAIHNTLVMTRYEYKLVAEVETDLGDVPLVLGNAGELNQVLLNLVVNAAHAVEDVVKRTKTKGLIRITSRRDEDHVEIRIQDSGGGIPSPIQSQIFEPFFTTKAVGRGTGQGLAIARAVVERHQGSLGYETKMDMGTTFIIRLPIAHGEAATQDASQSSAEAHAA